MTKTRKNSAHCFTHSFTHSLTRSLHAMSCIFSAAREDDSLAVARLLAAGVSPNERDSAGRSALHLCSSLDCFHTALVLLSSECSSEGVDVELQDYESGYTALHRAVYHGHTRMVLLLVKYGARLSVPRDCEKECECDLRRAEWRGGRSIRNIATWTSPFDHDGLSPFDLMSQILSQRRADERVCSEVLAVGKADFFLGIILPKAAEDVIKPRPLHSISGLDIETISCAKYHSAALTTCGELYTWGLGSSGRLGHGNDCSQPFPVPCELFSGRKVTKIACSENHMLAVIDSGALYSWGGNRFGQLGHGRLDDCCAPKRIDKLKRHFVCGVAAGSTHSVCYTSVGEVWTWGSNKHGQLGSRVTSTTGGKLGAPGSSVPVCVSWHQKASYDSDVLEVCASHTCTLVLRCGAPRSRMYDPTIPVPNDVYQWGNGSDCPSKVQFMSERSTDTEFTYMGSSTKYINIIKISAGHNHCVGVDFGGSVYTWGLGVAQLGHGLSQEPHISFPLLVESLLPENGGGKVVDASAAGDRTSVVTDVGDLYTWGSCSITGALGHGKHTYQPVPRVVHGVKGVKQVATGVDHMLILVSAAFPALPHDDTNPAIKKGNIECESESVSEELFVNPEVTVVDIPSLQQLCEVEVARNVTLRNVIAVLSFAEQYSLIQLFSFCLSFVALNLDIILVQLFNKLKSTTAPAARNAQLDCSEIDFLIHCFSDPFNDNNSSKLFIQKDSMQNIVTADYSAIGDTTMNSISADFEAPDIPMATPTDLPSILKAMKSLKKKLSAIDTLESKINQGLSTSETLKISKKLHFVAQYERLEKLKEEFSGFPERGIEQKDDLKQKTQSIESRGYSSNGKNLISPRKISKNELNKKLSNNCANIGTDTNIEIISKPKRKIKFRPVNSLFDEATSDNTFVQVKDDDNDFSRFAWSKVDSDSTICKTGSSTPSTILSPYTAESQSSNDTNKKISKYTAHPKKGKGKMVPLSEFLSPPPTPRQTQVSWCNETSKQGVWTTHPLSATASSCDTPSPDKLTLHRIQCEEENLRSGSSLKVMQGNSIPWMLDRRSIRADSLEDVMWRESLEQQKEEERLREEQELQEALAAISLMEQGGGVRGSSNPNRKCSKSNPESKGNKKSRSRKSNNIRTRKGKSDINNA